MTAVDDIHAICALPGRDIFPVLADLRLILYHVGWGMSASDRVKMMKGRV